VNTHFNLEPKTKSEAVNLEALSYPVQNDLVPVINQKYMQLTFLNTLVSARKGDFKKKTPKRTWLCAGISLVR